MKTLASLDQLSHSRHSPLLAKFGTFKAELDKTNIHEYRNQRGSRKVFGFDLVDASHDEIHIYGFNELTLSLYDQIQIGIVYIVSNGTVKESNPLFNHLKIHNEIFLGSSSTIQPCLYEYPLIPLHFFNFKTI